LSHLAPDRIVFRIALVLIAVMVLAQAIGFLFFLSGRPLIQHRGDLDAVESRLRAPVAALLAGASGERSAIAARFSTPRFGIRAESAFRPRDLVVDLPGFFPLRDRLLVNLADSIDQVVIEAPVNPRDLGPPLPWSGLRSDLPVTAWLRLRDGSWMAATMPAGDLLPRGPFFALIPWAGAGASILLISLLVARRVSATLRRFAGATERFGLDIAATPLAETGPAEVRSVLRAFNLMQARLKRFVADRTRMLAAISHDLMTPISRLRLRAEALPRGEARERMLGDLALMDRMVAATLDFARDDVAAEQRQRLDLASLVQSVCDEFADDNTGSDGGVTYRGPDYLEIVAAPTALGRAIRNVVENAVKYGARAEVTLSRSELGAEIAVSDGGPGIPEAELERVFEPFYRLDRARSSETGGSGLGLAIARNVLRAHGGEITLANAKGGGLTATMTLPSRRAG
jgi:signal transduction histidine kinase